MKISLRKKKLASGKISLFLEFYKGSIIDEQGKEKHNREFEYLKLYLEGKPKTASEKIKNKETLELAEKIKSIREAEYYTGKFGLVDNSKLNIRFIDYFEKLKEERSSYISNYGTWLSTKKYIDEYVHPSTTFREVSVDFVKGFKRYLDDDARTKHGTPLAHGTKYSYFNRFRAVIKQAYEDGYLTDVNLLKIKTFEEQESQREYLTHEELNRLAETECKYEVLKRTFIFSCLTGLRWSDIFKMQWEEVRDEENGCKIIFKQQKTNGIEYLYISPQARELLGDRTTVNNRVFVNLKYGTGANTELLRWCMKAGITKHITFHCARHTNAVLLLENGADIYTVQKCLGHKEIRTTEIYAKILDSKIKEASTLIPTLNL